MRTSRYRSVLGIAAVEVIVRDPDRCGRLVGEMVLPDGCNLGHELVTAA